LTKVFDIEAVWRFSSNNNSQQASSDNNDINGNNTFGFAELQRDNQLARVRLYMQMALPMI